MVGRRGAAPGVAAAIAARRCRMARGDRPRRGAPRWTTSPIEPSRHDERAQQRCRTNPLLRLLGGVTAPDNPDFADASPTAVRSRVRSSGVDGRALSLHGVRRTGPAGLRGGALNQRHGGAGAHPGVDVVTRGLFVIAPLAAVIIQDDGEPRGVGGSRAVGDAGLLRRCGREATYSGGSIWNFSQARLMYSTFRCVVGQDSIDFFGSPGFVMYTELLPGTLITSFCSGWIGS
jgi:hypothetical protein